MIAPRSGALPAAVVAASGAIGFGALTELLQRLQPARTADLLDIAANSIGATVAVLGILVARRLSGSGPGVP
jgi:VanZ family protein